MTGVENDAMSSISFFASSVLKAVSKEFMPEADLQCTQLRLQRLVTSHAIHFGINSIFILSAPE